MKLWSIQTKEAYEVLRSTGVLRARSDFIDPWYLPAYNWLACQMKELIGYPPEGVRYPIWAWHTVDWKQKKPDLRKSLFNAQPEGAVCLELEIDNSRVLLSDFENWHFVLNDWYYSEAHNHKNLMMLKVILIGCLQNNRKLPKNSLGQKFSIFSHSRTGGYARGCWFRLLSGSYG